MATMNISLPDKMKQWVEKQVATGRYANASDYFRDRVRDDQDNTAGLAHLQALIDEGLAGEPVELDLEEIRQGVKKELAASQASDAA